MEGCHNGIELTIEQGGDYIEARISDYHSWLQHGH